MAGLNSASDSGRRGLFQSPGVLWREEPGLHDGCRLSSLPAVRNELVNELCTTCNGKGQLTHRCRCKGRCKVYDEEQSELQGAPVLKDSPKCPGRGDKRVLSSVAYQAIKHLVPDLNERTWRRNWKPFYEGLTGQCHIEESTAERLFNRITR